jgi:hypothetical protein
MYEYGSYAETGSYCSPVYREDELIRWPLRVDNAEIAEVDCPYQY